MMCCHDHDDWECHGWHRFPGYHYNPSWRYYEGPAPEERRGYLEEEKRILEQRLKEIEARIAETGK